MEPEARLWSYLRGRMRGRWHAQRHEDKLTEGIPDLSFGTRGVNGWIELKARDEWPAREGTEVDVGLSAEQAEWLTARGRIAGRCFIMFRAGQEVLLFRWESARDLARGRYTRSYLRDLAVARWSRSVDPEELLEELTR